MRNVPCMAMVIAAGLVLAAFGALAQTAPPDATQMDPDAIVQALTPKPVPRGYQPRGYQPRGVTIEEPVDTPPPSIDLYINFDFDSAALGTDAQLTLKSVGTALSDPRLKGFGFKIAGHTDAVGTPEYNIELSRRRAEAVRQHLIYYYSIAAERITAEGYGKTRLLDPQHPEDGINRRVEITTVIPGGKSEGN
jgi:outer membrane protein OmpA-like peptidoglycan-associated protein